MKTLLISDEEIPFPPLTILLLLLLLVLIGSLAGAGLIFGLNAWWGQPFEELLGSLNAESSPFDRNRVRFSVLLNHLTTFVLPPIFLAVLLYRRRWFSFIGLAKRPKWGNAILGSFFILFALPIAQFTFWLNRKIPLPEWAVSLESSTTEMVNNILISTQPYELLFNLVVIALIPAIGEELVFRGFLQGQLHRKLGNGHGAIWLTALIFSAVHFQFEGFIPRMFLGALLGYLFYWTKNLWIPILAHFLNNGIQVFAQYLYQQEFSTYNPDQLDQVNWGLSAFSFIFVIFLGYQLYQFNREKLTETHQNIGH